MIVVTLDVIVVIVDTGARNLLYLYLLTVASQNHQMLMSQSHATVSLMMNRKKFLALMTMNRRLLTITVKVKIV